MLIACGEGALGHLLVQIECRVAARRVRVDELDGWSGILFDFISKMKKVKNKNNFFYTTYPEKINIYTVII